MLMFLNVFLFTASADGNCVQSSGCDMIYSKREAQLAQSPPSYFGGWVLAFSFAV